MPEGTKRTIQASKILEEIQKNEYVFYESVVVEGDLDLRKLDLQIRYVERTGSQKEIGLTEDVKIVQSGISILNSTFQGELDFSNTIFGEHVYFGEVTFDKDVFFSGAIFSKDSNFRESTFCRGAYFNESTFVKEAYFSGGKFNRGAYFKGAIFRERADFSYADFIEDALFNQGFFSEYASFDGVFFSEDALFNQGFFSEYASFDGAFFSEDVLFNGAKFEGDVLTFRDATFILAKSQEEACRRAKNVLSKAGNREEEEYHFYREMEAKRKQKGIYETDNRMFEKYSTLRAENLAIVNRFLWYDIVEHIFLQKIFGYGVHPKRLMISWGAIVLVFGVLYLYGRAITETMDWSDNFKVSFATAIAPGYIATIINPGGGGYRLDPAYQWVAMIETIVGTFLWAGFIATFAKKYMR